LELGTPDHHQHYYTTNTTNTTIEGKRGGHTTNRTPYQRQRVGAQTTNAGRIAGH
jgi:hypothetical protein